jgi:hypothetical protein
MSIAMKYFVIQASDGSFLRFSRGVAGLGPAGAHAIQVESSAVEDYSFAPRLVVPPTSAGFVAHTLALLQVMELVFGRQGSFVKGSEEDVKKLGELLRTLS